METGGQTVPLAAGEKEPPGKTRKEPELSDTGASTSAKAPLRHSGSTVPETTPPRVITIGQGEVIEIPMFAAHVSVTFNESLGPPFARLTVTLPGQPQAYKTFMSAATMDLGQGRSLSIQSIDWTRREIIVLPMQSD